MVFQKISKLGLESKGGGGDKNPKYKPYRFVSHFKGIDKIIRTAQTRGL